MAKQKEINIPWHKNIIIWILILFLLLFGFIIFWQVIGSTKYGTPIYRPKINN